MWTGAALFEFRLVKQSSILKLNQIDFQSIELKLNFTFHDFPLFVVETVPPGSLL